VILVPIDWYAGKTMKLRPTVSAQTILALALLGSIPARATTIEIGVATQTGISNITTEATGTGVTGASMVLFPYDNYLVTAAASDPSPVDLASATLEISGDSTHPLFIYITETGLTSKQSILNFQSQFSASVPSGWSEVETTYVSTANQAYAETKQLASMTGSGTKSITTAGVNVGPAGSMFSVTEAYEFISDAIAGLDVSGESIQAAPAPSIGAGVPSMLAIGAMLLGTTLMARWRRS
jgi:hypothetical protein